jgi:hypothetical protein
LTEPAPPSPASSSGFVPTAWPWLRYVDYLKWVSLTVAVVLLIVYVVGSMRANAALRDRAEGEAERAAAAIDLELSRVPAVVGEVVADISSGRVDKSGVNARLQTAIDITPQLLGLGAGYRPHRYDPELRLYAPSFRRQGETTVFVPLDALYDYSLGETPWYQLGTTSPGGWTEPATDSTQGAVVEYAAPFTDPASTTPDEVAGVVHATMSLSEIDEIIQALDLGDVGYGFLISREGFAISHPFAREFGDAGAADDPSLGARSGSLAQAQRVFDAARAAGTNVVENILDPVTGEPSWVLARTVPSTGWTVGIVFFQQQAENIRMFRRQKMTITAAALLTGLLALWSAILRRFDGRIIVLWGGVVASCLCLVIAIGMLWQHGFGAPVPPVEGQTVFANAGTVQRFVLDTTRTSLQRRGTLPRFVSTGVILETFELTGPNNVVVSGYVWQTYPANIPETITRGFLLPEASDVTIREAYRRTTDDAETIGWFIKAEIRQSFDYAKYPLDQQDFRIRIRHQDLDQGVILIPDLESYQIIHPLARLGLEKDMTLPGWTVARTQFSNLASNRNTSFGIADSAGGLANELAFNVIINRQILEPLFSSVLPIAVSSFMVFTLLLAVHPGTRSNVVQFLAAYSGLFFILILSELDLRRRMSSSAILYIEYFYFVVYAAILSQAMITLTNTYTGHFPWLEQREHIIPKLLYWPVILTAMVVVTFVVFY